MRPTKEEIAHLLAAFNRSEWDEMDLELGGFRLRLSARSDGPVSTNGALLSAPPTVPSRAALLSPMTPTEKPTSSLPAGAVAIRAPSLGRFWRKPKPTEPPFANVGAEVRVGDVVCIVEVMKLFTQVKSDVAGRVLACPIEDGAMVEFDEVLFVLQPGGA